MGTKAQMQAYLDAQNGTVGGAKYWQYVYGWSGGGLPYCAVGVSAALKATDTECAYFPSKVAFDSRDKAEIGSAYRTRNNLEYLDPIAFDWDGDGGGDHVGFFIKYLGNGKARTFEFNVSNTAAYRTRNVSDIICGIRPKYSDNKPRKLHVDGKFGVNTKKRVQETLQLHGFYIGYTVDGDWAYYSKYETQRYLKSIGYYRRNCDGDFAYYSNVALQTYLRDLGYYAKSYMAKLGYKDIACVLDGDWGFYTTVALQCALNDGRF